MFLPGAERTLSVVMILQTEDRRQMQGSTRAGLGDSPNGWAPIPQPRASCFHPALDRRSRGDFRGGVRSRVEQCCAHESSWAPLMYFENGVEQPTIATAPVRAARKRPRMSVPI